MKGILPRPDLVITPMQDQGCKNNLPSTRASGPVHLCINCCWIPLVDVTAGARGSFLVLSAHLSSDGLLSKQTPVPTTDKVHSSAGTRQMSGV